MSQTYLYAEIRRTNRAARKAAAILAACTERQRPRAEQYAGRVRSRLIGLEQGRADNRQAAGEETLARRIERLRRDLPAFDPASYADGWRYSYYA